MDFRHLEEEWHPVENLPLVFDEQLNDYEKYWWVCPQGHIWSATLQSRKQGRQCRRCPNKRTKSNNLAVSEILSRTHPSLAAEWHPIKNEDLSIDQITVYFSSKVWWFCPEGHEWTATPYSRGIKGYGCPECRNSGGLTLTNPELLNEWHPTANGYLTANQVNNYSYMKVWWVCSKNHSWEASIVSRTKGKGCPVCYSTALIIAFLEKVTPSLVAEYHPTNNGKFTASQIHEKSSTKIWWICSEGHEWEDSLKGRILRGRSCYSCDLPDKLVHDRASFSEFPLLAQELHPTKNYSLRGQVTPQYPYSIWWVCQEGHEWVATPLRRIKNDKGCRVCSGHQVLVGVNDLNTVDPSRAREFHPTKNGILLPEDIPPQFEKSLWWKCENNHEWESRITKLSINNTSCSVCIYQNLLNTEWNSDNNTLGRGQIPSHSRTKIWWRCVKDHEWQSSPYERTDLGKNCPICSNKTLLASEWHPSKNEDLSPERIITNPQEKFWWRCSEGHEWEASAYNRIRNRTGTLIACNLCINLGKNVNASTNLLTTHPHIAAEWHPTANGALTPEHITAGANHKYWWLGACGHEWQSFLSNRIKGFGTCPECWTASYVSKPEQEIYDYICKLDNNMDVRQSSKIARKELDIYIPEKKFAVEFNGVYWHSERFRASEYHYKKWMACKRKGITLLQIWEDDWKRNPEQIKFMIAHSLGLSNQRTINADETIVKNVEQIYAEKFLNEHHIEGYVSGCYYLGLFDAQDMETLVALLVLDKETGENGNTLNIVRYSMSMNIVDGFAKLLLYAMETYNPDTFIAIADNCGLDGHIYSTNGFSEESSILPDYMYLIGIQRRSKSEYSMDTFRDDPKLEWAEGFTVEELAYLNDLIRIWDAGKTRYRY